MKSKDKSARENEDSKKGSSSTSKKSKKNESPSIILTKNGETTAATQVGGSSPASAPSKKKKYRSLRLRRDKHDVIPASASGSDANTEKLVASLSGSRSPRKKTRLSGSHFSAPRVSGSHLQPPEGVSATDSTGRKRSKSLIRQLRDEQDMLAQGIGNLYELKISFGGKTSHLNMLRSDFEADIVVNLSSGKTFSVHSFVLSKRCPELHRMASGRRGRFRIDLSKRPEFTDALFSSLLQFIYGGDIDLHAACSEPVASVYLYALATALKLDRLAKQSERFACEAIDLTRVYALLSAANETKQQTILDHCVYFCAQHYKDFVTSPQAKNLGIDLFRDVCASCAGGGPEKPTLPEELPACTYLQDFESLLSDNQSHDCFVRFGSNMRVGFHGPVLAAHSKAFWAAFQERGSVGDLTESLNPDQRLTEGAFRAMLRFVYVRDCALSPPHACELALYAPDHFMDDLQYVAEETIASNVSDAHVLQIMKVTYTGDRGLRPEMVSLRSTCVAHLCNHIRDIDLDPIVSMPAEVPVDLLLAWQGHKQMPLPDPAAAKSQQEHESTATEEKEPTAVVSPSAAATAKMDKGKEPAEEPSAERSTDKKGPSTEKTKNEAQEKEEEEKEKVEVEVEVDDENLREDQPPTKGMSKSDPTKAAKNPQSNSPNKKKKKKSSSSGCAPSKTKKNK